MKKLFLFFGILQILRAQEGVDIKVQVNKSPQKFDTTCYKSFSDKLILGFTESYKSYGITAHSKRKNPYSYNPDINYIAESKVNYGALISYDKLSIEFAFSSSISMNDSTKGKSTIKSLAFSFGGNKFLIEPSYYKFKGFYDQNTGNYDSAAYKKTGIYFKNPSLQAVQYKLKFLYFFNYKRYANRASSSYSYRQLKTKGSWVFAAQGFYNDVSTDSSLWPTKVALAYDTLRNLNHFKIYGGGVWFGYGFNWVFGKRKNLFLSVIAVGLLNFQEQEYNLKDSSFIIKEQKFSISPDIRISGGYNAKRFFFIVSAISDYNAMLVRRTQLQTVVIPVSAYLGYRFNMKMPKLYKKFTETKLYNWL